LKKEILGKMLQQCTCSALCREIHYINTNVSVQYDDMMWIITKVDRDLQIPVIKMYIIMSTSQSPWTKEN